VLVEAEELGVFVVVVVDVSASGFFFGSGCTGALPNPLFFPPPAACSATSDVWVFDRDSVFEFVVTQEFAIEKANVVLTALERRAKIIPVEYKGDFMISCAFLR
jgi:hypothetical protein